MFLFRRKANPKKTQMKYYIGLCLIGFYFLVTSCNDKKDITENGKEVRKITKWEDGSIQSEGYFINDTIKEGPFKKYYRSGKIEMEVNYHNNKRQGKTMKYFEDGTLKQYQANNLDGKAIFGIEYTKEGTIKSISGNGIVDISVNKTELQIGDTLKILFLLATPKKSSLQFEIIDDLRNSQSTKSLKIDERLGEVRYARVFLKKGIVKWGGTYIIKFENGKEQSYSYEGISNVR